MAESVVVRSDAACRPTMPSTPSAKIRIPISASSRYAPVCLCSDVGEVFMVQLHAAGQACGSVAAASGSQSLVPTLRPELLIATFSLRGVDTFGLVTLRQVSVGLASTLGTIRPKPSKVICVASAGVGTTVTLGAPSVNA